MDMAEQRNEPRRRRLARARRWCAGGLLVLGPAGLLVFAPETYVSGEALRMQALSIALWVWHNGDLGLLLFLLAHAGAAALSLPLVPILSVLGGFLFSIWTGAAVVYVGSLAGAIAAFLLARTACGAGVRRRLGSRLGGLNREIVRNGFFYVLLLRLLPIAPFWMANVVPAIFGIRFGRFLAASLLGLAPWALLYAAVGHGLGRLLFRGDISLGEALSTPEVMVPLLALAALTLAAVWYRYRQRRHVPT
jgi:uncharacterized membrane protein YdjX (TVP38/TMEM64 family)